MTPKEKAIELYEKFYYITPSVLADKKQDFTAKGCALAAVDEIISETYRYFSDRKSYWQQVRQEIAKL